MSRRVRLRTKTPAGTKRKASGDEHPAASESSLRRRRRLDAGGTQVACALPALGASILQLARELGRRPVEYNNPANAEQQRERALAKKIRKNMSKLSGATRSELEGLRADAPSEAVPALDPSILQQVRELGRRLV